MYDPNALRPGSVVLVEGTGLLAAAIRWATVCPFSHAAIVSDDGRIVEAVERVRAVPLDTYAARGWAYEVAASRDQHLAAAQAARSRLGEPYGYRALMEDALRYVAHVPVVARLTPQDLTCSGLVAWCWLRAGVVLTWEPLPSPASLAYSPLLLGPRPWSMPP
jgi:hypothetical protein